MKRYFWRIIPYFSLVASTGLFAWLAYLKINKPLSSNWLLNISANLISVLFIYFLYELIKAKSEKELKKGIFQYTKSYIDGDILSILHTISKLIYGVQNGKSLIKTLALTKLTIKDLEKIIQDKEFLGFQLFKLWEDTYTYFSKVLENSFILNRLNDNHILIIINLINIFKETERHFSDESNFEIAEKKDFGHKIVSGVDINKENIQFPNRYLLLKVFKDEKYVVEDFGDFRHEDIEKLLNIYKVKSKNYKKIASDVYEILDLINKWISLTGGELRI